MDVGLQMVFASYGWSGVSDEQVWDEEIKLARLAADSGFDALWSVEHHFNDYSFCPDNLQLMAYLAAVCPNIDLAISFRFGGTPFDLAESGLKLYAKEVLPVLHSWKIEAMAQAAE